MKKKAGKKEYTGGQEKQKSYSWGNCMENIPGTTQFHQYAEKYHEWQAVKNYSGYSIKKGKLYIRGFIDWCIERGIEDVSEVSRPVVERYQAYLFNYRKKSGKPLSFRTQASRLTAIKMFFRFLARNRYIMNNPAAEIEMPKIERRLPREIFTVSETEKILNAVNVTEASGLRDRAILETFYSTGMRRMELANLCVYDIDSEREIVMIREGKGKKDRMVPIGKSALLWIRRYIEEARTQFAITVDEQILFLTEAGKPFHLDHVSRLVAQYVKKSGVRKKGSCHLFRHTAATLMHDNGADIRYIQQMLGHESLETTQIYTNVSIKKLKEIHRETHPAEIEYRKEKGEESRE